jgi:hypothetical protein
MRHSRTLLLLASLVVLALIGSAAPPAPAAPADAPHCLYLPMLGGGGGAATGGPGAAGCLAAPTAAPSATATTTVTATTTASATATVTTAPTATATATATQAPAAAALAGSVRLRPEHRVIQMQRRPLQYVVVLDASGSMSANFAGQCNAGYSGSTSTIRQCANGPDGSPPSSGGAGTYYWREPTERRIYVAKGAIERLINGLNMPGNPGYDPALPADQLAIVWFNHGAAASNVSAFSSSPSTLIAGLAGAGSYGNDPYRTNGGSNWAAGLYRTVLGFETAPTTVAYNGQTWAYERRALLITDGISNQFLDKADPYLNGGSSNKDTYPAGHTCHVDNVLEIASCQITGDEIRGGGTYMGMDRPITQAVRVSEDDLQASGIEVYALSIGNVPSTGLSDGVASAPSAYYAAPTLELYPDGSTNVDQIIDGLPFRSETGTCTAVVAPEWATTMAPESQPEDVPGVAFPQVGVLQLEQIETGAIHTAPIVVDTAHTMSYRVEGLPAGAYRLTSIVFYRGEDQQTRGYSLLETAGGPQPAITVEVSGGEQTVDALSLRLAGDVCAEP